MHVAKFNHSTAVFLLDLSVVLTWLINASWNPVFTRDPGSYSQVLLLYRIGWIYPYLSLANAPDLNLISLIIKSPLNRGSVGKESTCNVGDAGRREFDSCVGKIPLDEGMATTHSSILAWRIPWTEEPGGLQSMG